MDFTPQGTDTCLVVASQTDDSGTTASMGPTSAAVVGTLLCRADDYFPRQLRHLLDKIRPLLNLVGCRNFRKKRNLVIN